MKACKLTRRAVNIHGYGQVKRGGRQIGAHVAAWIDEFGPVPKGKCVLHKCDVRRCVELTHLFLGTKGDNNRGRAAKGRNGVGKGRLTRQQVIATRRVFAQGGSIVARARDFGVTRQALYYVRDTPSWKGCK